MAKEKPKKPRSIELKLARGEHLTVEQIRRLLLRSLGELETRPFELYKHCNFYVTPVCPIAESFTDSDYDTIDIKPMPCAADKYGV